jgi:hypothetical protein
MDAPSIGILGGAAAAVITAYAAFVAANRPAKPADPPLDVTRRSQDSIPESIEARVSRLEEKEKSADRRITSCEADVRGVQDEVDDMRTAMHTIERGAIERAGQTNEKLAALTGAITARGGRR